MSTEADNQPKQKIDIAHEDLSNNALRAHVHGPEMAEQHSTAGWTTKRRLLAGGLALGLIGGGVAVETIISNNLTPNHQTDSTDVQPTTDPSAIAQEGFPPTAQPSPISTEVINTLPVTPNPESSNSTLKTLEIEAAQSDEEMAKDFIHTFSSWRMAGATPEAKAVRSSQYGNLTLQAYAEKIAAEQTAIYAPILFGNDYTSNPDILRSVKNITDGNAKNILAFLQTAGTTNPVNKEPYTRSTVFDKLTSATVNGSEKNLTIDYHETDNSDKNIIGASNKSTVNGNKGVANVSLRTSGAKMIITSYTLEDK